MKSIIFLLLSFTLLPCKFIRSQQVNFDKIKFFEDTSVINATITTDITKLLREKSKIGVKFPAKFSTTMKEEEVLNNNILLEIRGHFRRTYCYLPPLKVIFDPEKKSPDKSLGTLKLVSQCKTSEMDEQYLLKEYLVYKIYNLITDMSFKVRLLQLTLADSSRNKKPITEFAYLMEDIKEVGKRNNCKEWKNEKMDPRQTDPHQILIVAIFEYMIGNTDWGVSANHNTRLLRSKKDSLQRPYVVPYDFDFSGFVNTSYSSPDPNLDINNVQERLYRGFPRPLEEVNRAVDIFKNQKSNIYALINNFDLLTSKTKKDLNNYLDPFFVMINKPSEVKRIFIDNARTQ